MLLSGKVSYLHLFSLQRTKLMGTSIHVHARFIRRKKKGRGGGGKGAGKGKGKGNLTGQLTGEQCNSPLIQSTLHAPLRLKVSYLHLFWVIILSSFVS